MNNEKTVNSTIKDSTVKATPKKKKMKETSEIPLKHGKRVTTIMTIVTLGYVCPIFIVLMNSFKANTFVKTDTFAWPTGEALVGWANYIKGFTFGNYPFFKSVLYSFVITVLSTALILICTSMAAWYIACLLYTSPATIVAHNATLNNFLRIFISPFYLKYVFRLSVIFK